MECRQREEWTLDPRSLLIPPLRFTIDGCNFFLYVPDVVLVAVALSHISLQVYSGVAAIITGLTRFTSTQKCSNYSCPGEGKCFLKRRAHQAISLSIRLSKGLYF